MPAYFNLPFSINLTQNKPIDKRFVVQNTASLQLLATQFEGLGPIWVKDENWYYYFATDDASSAIPWPKSGSYSPTGSSGGSYLYEQLIIQFNGQISMSIDLNYDSHFLQIENLVFKRDVDFNQSINGGQKFVTWDEKNGQLEPDDKIILVYNEL